MGYGLVGQAISGNVTGFGNLGTTLQSADVYLKQWYIDQNQFNNLMYPKNSGALARLARLPGSTMFEGRELVVALRIGRSNAQSKSFTTAQTQASNRTGARGRFIVPVDHDYGVARVSNQLIKASKGKMGAVLKLLADETDHAITGLRQKRCTALFAPEFTGNNARNSIGALTAAVAGGSFTLKDAGHASNFDIGDAIRIYSADGSTARAGAPWIVRSVDRQGGVISLNTTAGAAVTTIPGSAANDIVLRDGDYQQVGLTPFSMWLPARTSGNAFSASNSTLHGLDRSLDRARLAGFYSQIGKASANVPADLTFTNAVRKAISRIINLTGSAPNAFYCNSLVENWIAQEQSQNIRLDMSGGGAMEVTQIGMGKLAFKHSKGYTEIVTDSFCPIGDAYLIDEQTFSLQYLGSEGDDFVDFAQNPAGGILLSAHNGAGVEIRCESFGNLVCNAPGRNARFGMTADLISKIVA